MLCSAYEKLKQNQKGPERGGNNSGGVVVMASGDMFDIASRADIDKQKAGVYTAVPCDSSSTEQNLVSSEKGKRQPQGRGQRKQGEDSREWE